ncbi:MAG: T9SS type A sorting domain-containing protein [Acidobacteriota bacterium]
MKAIIISLTFLLLLSSEATYSQSNWKWISHYPHGNIIYSIAASGNGTYFLANKSTFSVSRDTGRTVENLPLYAKTTDGMGTQNSMAFADSLNGFLLDLEHGEFRTTDGGRSWRQTLRYGCYMVTFADSKTGWKTGYYGIQDSTNFAKTTDGGESWFELNPISRNANESVRSIYALDSLNVWICSSNYQTKNIGSLFYSSDGGKNWGTQSTGLTPDTSKQIFPAAIRINKSGLGILIASVINKSTSWIDKSIILRTENYGKTWAVINSSVEGILSSIVSVNDSIWIIHGNGKNNNYCAVQYRSTDFGKSFLESNILEPENNNLSFTASGYNPLQKVIFLASGGDLFRSLDFGKTYSMVTSENTLKCFDFALDGSTSNQQLAAAVSSRRDHFLLSHDGGRTWQLKPLYLSKEDKGMIQEVQVSGGSIFIITTDYIYTLNDNGERLSYIEFAPGARFHLSAYSAWNYMILKDAYSSPGNKPTILYVGNREMVLFPHEIPIPPNYIFNSVKLTGPKEIIGCGSYKDSSGSNGFIFTSSNGGTDWRIIQTLEAFRDIYMVTGSFGYAFSDKNIYTTEDNWRTIKTVYELNNNSVIDAVNFPDSIHGIMRSHYHFYETSDKGKSWYESGLDMPMSGSIRKMQYNNQGDLLVIGYDGFIMKFSEKTSKESSGQNGNIHELSYELFQNYPNPFNPATQIGFRLSEKGIVELKVFDMLGREVKTLLNEVKDAGTYSVPFNAAELPSGIYIYRLKAGSEVMVRKMILLK